MEIDFSDERSTDTDGRPYPRRRDATPDEIESVHELMESRGWTIDTAWQRVSWTTVNRRRVTEIGFLVSDLCDVPPESEAIGYPMIHGRAGRLRWLASMTPMQVCLVQVQRIGAALCAEELWAPERGWRKAVHGLEYLADQPRDAVLAAIADALDGPLDMESSRKANAYDDDIGPIWEAVSKLERDKRRVTETNVASEVGLTRSGLDKRLSRHHVQWRDVKRGRSDNSN